MAHESECTCRDNEILDLAISGKIVTGEYWDSPGIGPYNRRGPYKLSTQSAEEYRNAKARGYCFCRSRSTDPLGNAYAAWCDINRLPHVWIEQRGSRARVTLDMAQTAGRLDSHAMSAIGVAVNRLRGEYRPSDCISDCYISIPSVQIERAEELAAEVYSVARSALQRLEKRLTLQATPTPQ